MPGLAPGIHVFTWFGKLGRTIEDVNGRDKPRA